MKVFFQPLNQRALSAPATPLESSAVKWEDLARQARFRATDLAQLCGISLRTLQRHFKREYRTTVSDWLSAFRLEQARLELLHGEGVKQVAYGLGYKQLSHFSRAFKERYGIPPSLFSRQTEPANLAN
ncbi:MAG TPA: helix-turn-helix transcriptional regulator [Verrucomicrobiae bacterium]|jgi:AraC-like DNA-binding protein|nr:helix-turn-helix transcriptional regulator [Verrucomicrobiae bacterium]